MPGKRIHVAAAIIVRDRKIFATQRGYGEYKDWWEFPGGKIEPGESSRDALVREIREELEVRIGINRFYMTVEYDYPGFHLTMDTYLCNVGSGVLHLLEHEDARWLSQDELDQVQWLPADDEILQRLKTEDLSEEAVRRGAPLVILTGPTAVGKTSLSIRLAKLIDAEIISADSMQVYRGMDIGTAKIRPEETEGVPHHLIDVLDPKEPFDVVRFKKMASDAILGILRRGKVPLLTGGTGFYIQSVLYDIEFSEEEEDPALRQSLETLAGEIGPQKLHDLLREADPDSADAIPAGNVKRVIRALEYYRKNGRPISEHNREQRQRASAYNAAYFVLTDERARIYDRINLRVDRMMEDGLIEEVERLRSEGCSRSMVSMQGIGYRQVFDYLDGKAGLEETSERIKQETRHFAKRQLTWFRREKDVIWLERDPDEADPDSRILERMLEVLRTKEILSE